MVNQFLNKYNNFIKNWAEARNMSMNETVALASIIQGEAAKRSEMNIISSVYHNHCNILLCLITQVFYGSYSVSPVDFNISVLIVLYVVSMCCWVWYYGCRLW